MGRSPFPAELAWESPRGQAGVIPAIRVRPHAV